MKTDRADTALRKAVAPAPRRAADAAIREPMPQTALSSVLQRAAIDPHSLSRADAVQLQRSIGNSAVGRLLAHAAPRTNRTGLPDQLKSGVENLSGLAMDDVRVHYNSSRPAQLQALAFTQGSDIFIAPGQARHLPHEAWHVVQQKQGCVTPTLRLRGVAINDDLRLEREADLMGPNALVVGTSEASNRIPHPAPPARDSQVIQRAAALGSDPALLAQYNILLGSPAFAELDAIVTAHQDINLVDSAAAPHAREVDYNPTTHTIRVPVTVAPPLPPALAGPLVARPLADINDDLLFEMQNARKRGDFSRAASRAPVLAATPSLDEKRVHPYRVAAYALSVEWDEWVNVAEHSARSVKITGDLAAVPGGAVANVFGPEFPATGAGYYVFENYLNVQLPGHTLHYDRLASSQNWKGKGILGIAKQRYAKSLKITPEELTKWSAGDRKSHVKTSNPFGAAIVKEATR